MIELHLYMIERWEDCNAFSDTTDAFTLGSTALGLEWIFAKTKKWSSIMICPSQKIPKNIDSRCTCVGL